MKILLTETIKDNLSNVAIVPGQIIYAKDSNEIYYDTSDNIRLESNNAIILLNNESEKDNLTSPLSSKLYIIKDTGNSYIYDATIGWKSISSISIIPDSTNTPLPSDTPQASFKSNGKVYSIKVLSSSVYMDNGTTIVDALKEKAPIDHKHYLNDIINFPESFPANGGRSESADKLTDAHKINGVPFDGSKDINITSDPNYHTHLKSQITDFPTSLPANGGNAHTIDNKEVSDFAPSGFGLGESLAQDIGDSDINNAYKGGWYRSYGGNQHTPATGSFMMYVTPGPNYHQELYYLSRREIYFRDYNAETAAWSEFRRVLDPTDFPTSLPANGGNAHTIDNKEVSDFATAEQGKKADAALPADQYNVNDIINKINSISSDTSKIDAYTLGKLDVNKFFHYHTDSILNDLNNFVAQNRYMVWDTGNGAMKNTPEGNVVQGSAKVFVVENFGLSPARLVQRCTYIYPLNNIKSYIRNRVESTWGSWEKNINLKDLANVAISGNYNDLSNVPISLPANGGNADTAKSLYTARKINGVSFNGTSDITITANPNAHKHKKIDITDFPTTMTANGGRADTADRFTTARKINGVSFNGTSDITITANPNAHTHTKSQITDFPTSLPANGGNADTLQGKHASDFATAAQGVKADAALPADQFTSEIIINKINSAGGLGTDTDGYKMAVLNWDDDMNPTQIQYRRKSDNTLALQTTASNTDSNGYYQTLTCKYYKSDGSTIDKTITYHFTFLDSGYIKTSDGGI